MLDKCEPQSDHETTNKILDVKIWTILNEALNHFNALVKFYFLD